jgi:hypothetical protein
MERIWMITRLRIGIDRERVLSWRIQRVRECLVGHFFLIAARDGVVLDVLLCFARHRLPKTQFGLAVGRSWVVIRRALLLFLGLMEEETDFVNGEAFYIL